MKTDKSVNLSVSATARYAWDKADNVMYRP